MDKKQAASTGKGSSAKVSKKEAALVSKALAKEQKKKKQEQKAFKKEKKKSSKNKKDNDRGDDDDVDDDEFERIVAELVARDTEHNQITVEKLDENPSFRAAFSMTIAGTNPQEGCIIFGGEFFDGSTSICYNDLLRFRILSNSTLEWKKIMSPNSPPPRCAHASCTTPTHMYIFGGEFSTAWRFHHYNDLWRFDFKLNQWTNMPSINGPSARSGARMISWKNFLVVFGGFYEASRGVRWHDDLFFYDLRTEKWSKAKFVSTSQQPSPRSGFHFATHPNKPLAILYGGYSKVAASASAQKGRAMDDMWILHLSMPLGKQAGALPECKWEFVPRKGAPPSKRSGATSCMYKNRLLVFGGVSDVETQNDVVGQFFNSLHAFDMDRMRWFELSLKGTGANKKKGSRRNKNNDNSSSATKKNEQQVHHDGGSVSGGDSDDDDEDDDPEDSAAAAFGLRDDAFYVIIDGKFVLVEDDGEGSDDDNKLNQASVTQGPSEALSNLSLGSSSGATEGIHAPKNNPIPAGSDLLPVAKEILNQEHSKDISNKTTSIPWGGLPSPEPRICSGVCVLGSKFYVYGGTSERGDTQITFDDMWSLDLNKMDTWQHVISGKWTEQKWSAAGSDEEDSSEDDESDDEDGEEDDDAEADQVSGDERESDDDDQDETMNNVRVLAEEIRALRDELDVDQEQNTPNPGESMKDFFARTVTFWLDEVAKKRLAESDDSRLSGKELRRMAFQMAKYRFELLSPLLDKLNALQEAQRLAEEEAAEEAHALAEKMARRNAKKALKKKDNAT